MIKQASNKMKMREFALAILVMMVVFVGQTCSTNISRASFPKGFVFGTASSAYQYEGAVKEDGRGPAVWDKFAHSFGKILDGSNADVAVDQYHRYPEDIKLMKDMGMDAYRFSIAWSRIYPNGTGAINQAGVKYYNKLINALLANGIFNVFSISNPVVRSLEDRYNGWLSPQSVNDFARYAGTCFQKFGDRVKNWITFNEPQTVAVQGYDVGVQAPGRCSIVRGAYCKAGNSSTEPYIVSHSMLLSHAAAVDVYRKYYKRKQHGRIGITLDTFWYDPSTNSTDDIEAAQREIDFHLGWFLEPLITGDYPRIMRTRVGSRLPKFSLAESVLLKGSYDFIGINHYSTWYATLNSTNVIGVVLNDTFADSGAFISPLKGQQPIGDRAKSPWLYIVPHGIRSLMNYIKQKYGNPLVIITENGMDDGNSVARKVALKDDKRIKYHHDYLENLLASIREDGCNVKGYFVWSLLDNWEWGFGYSSRFGLYYVDYNNGLKRYPKKSASWFKNFLTSSQK